MDYQNTLKYLYESMPMFQQIGGKAYKPGLETTHKLDEHFGYPHQQFKTIHIAGTNGKGSCSHTIAAVLQSAGYRVGLFTSPHLVDFRERIRINGEMIPEEYVVNFVADPRSFFEPLHPSFFELTTAMAFRYFADQKVDVAVIEVGMGGRLDCTNIIQPDLCIITNIGFCLLYTSYAISGRYITQNSQRESRDYQRRSSGSYRAGKRSREARVHNKGKKSKCSCHICTIHCPIQLHGLAFLFTITRIKRTAD